MIEKYSIDDIKDILPHKLEVEVRDYDAYLTIDNFRIYFQQIYQYHLFCFVIKRAYDFGIIPKNPEFNISDAKHHIALDNKLNMIISSTPGEFDRGMFDKKIGTFIATGEHAFWGNIEEDHLYIQVGEKYIKKKFVDEPTERYKHKVLIQPDDYDSSYIVYIDGDIKPKEPMRIIFTFAKYDNELVFKKLIKSDWIY